MVAKLAVLVMVMTTTWAHNDLCSAPKSTVLKFSISSQENATGHNIIKTDLSSGHYIDGHHGTTLDVEVASATCEDSEMNSLSAIAVRQPVLVRRKAIPSDYTLSPDLSGAYKVHPEMTTWFEARNVCIAEGGHLFIPDSEAESRQVFNLFKETISPRNEAGWIGFHDMFQEGVYLTVKGKPLSFMEWFAGDPHKIGQNCGCFYLDGKLCDHICSEKVAFVCEFVQ